MELTELTEIPVLPPGLKMIDRTLACDCKHTEKIDLGPTSNADSKNVHIFKCPHHQTILKHHILTGEIV